MSILIGIVGAFGSMVALVAFLVKMHRNGLQFPGTLTPSSFYESVGMAYSGGFAAGFSLCFFLTLLAVAVGTWYESRRAAPSVRTTAVRMPLVAPPRED